MNRKGINFSECPSVGSTYQSFSAMSALPMEVKVHLQWFSPSLLCVFLLSPCKWRSNLAWELVAQIGSKETGALTNRRECECAEHMGNTSGSLPRVKWRWEREMTSPSHKKGKEKNLSLLLALFPFALTTTPDLHWEEGPGSWLLNVKYSYRTPSITCAA